jgi:hypothetical protein
VTSWSIITPGGCTVVAATLVADSLSDPRGHHARPDRDLRPAAKPEWLLWYRAGKGRPWEAVDAIGCGCRHNGDWTPLAKGQHPNDRPPPRG